MRELKKLFLLLVILPLFIGYIGCKEDSTTDPTPAVNEFDLAVKYLEDAKLLDAFAKVITAENVYLNLDTTGSKQYIIDIRAAADFAIGHIKGAKNVAMKDVLTHIKSLSPLPEKIVITCYAGQSAAYTSSCIMMAGYNNVFSLKWGMSSWDSLFAKDVWLKKMNNTRKTEFVKTASPALPAITTPPTLKTGKTTAAEILKVRIDTLLNTNYNSQASLLEADVYTNKSKYFIINYWPQADYLNIGHIDGSYNYIPKDAFTSAKYLKTLPIDKEIVVYCYTGQTSGFIAAYLRALGYNAKSLRFGANSMIYDDMTSNKFSASEIKGYPYVTGP